MRAGNSRGRLLSAVFALSLVAAGCEPNSISKSPGTRNGTSAPTVLLTDTNFAQEALSGPQPVLVVFWAEWCSVCLQMKPELYDLAIEYAEWVKIGELNISDFPFTAEKYAVHATPTLLLFQNGELVQRLEGRQSKGELMRLLESRISPSSTLRNGVAGGGS